MHRNTTTMMLMMMLMMMMLMMTERSHTYNKSHSIKNKGNTPERERRHAAAYTAYTSI
jgi:hypothetical protein